jgi:acid phosphatase (class A)
MAELVPSRADAILERGRDFGDSRVLCGYHYPSDIEAGRAIASGVIARLHGDAGFRRDLDAARGELARAYPAGRGR